MIIFFMRSDSGSLKSKRKDILNMLHKNLKTKFGFIIVAVIIINKNKN